ncbi:hypothetical protein [Spirosoma rhododendri]|uniref:Uncharacterized protein n=1 Tax=Spirosoma rhododendri TaxID=2728024 RepID=A0A7L5DQ20_9BACT|nr:hypothetical protein [Spirosoma rhododendri]QJD80574.1 hypothetical protein HH216_20765 [Spirosoma rhododendri]
MSQQPLSVTPLSDEHEQKLRELTAQSWNLELVISGAAMFTVLQLPDLMDEGLDYIRYNLMTQTAGVAVILPGLAYSLMKGMCYVLFLAFLTNFVMRAFWVSLVGLLAVYPGGIQYDQLPFSTKSAKDRMAAELGPLNAYILRLDQRCNIVFAVSFLFVSFMLGIALIYMLLFLFYFGLRPIIPDAYWPVVRVVLFALAGLFVVTAIVSSLPKIRANPRVDAMHDRLNSLPKLISLGTSKPSAFILNTFRTNLPKKRLGQMTLVMFVGFMLLLTVELIANADRIYGHAISPNLRHLFPNHVVGHAVNANDYNDQRAEDAYIDAASIQSDVIREPFIRLYVAYPKALDTLLTRLSPKPEWDDALPRDERRRLQTEWSINQISRFVRIDLNDSLYQKPDLLFAQIGTKQQQGWQTVLIPTNLKTGKNLLKIGIQPDSATAETPIITIPFWYVPEN